LNQSSSQPVDPQFLQGLFGPNSRVRFRDIKDGTANVVLIGERRLPEVGTDWPAHQFEGQFNSYWAGLPDVRRVNPLTIVATATGGNVERNGEGDPLNLTGNLNATKITGWKMNLPYFGINCGDGGELFGDVTDLTPVSAGFSSTHTGGVNVAISDGSVKFISQNIDPIVFTNLMRRSDGQELGEF
jgi:hypothetical protein